MAKKIIGLVEGENRFNLEVCECNWFNKFRGLMFRRRENANILLFDFNKPTRIKLHSLFVFFHFLVLWLDEKNNILDKKLVCSRQFLIQSKTNFNKIIEIPMNKQNRKIIELLVGEKKDLKRK